MISLNKKKILNNKNSTDDICQIFKGLDFSDYIPDFYVKEKNSSKRMKVNSEK